MAESWEQRERVMDLMGEGSARWIRLTVVFTLALSGIVLQALVYWYGLQTAEKEWGTVGMGVWAFAIGVWILIVGMTLALLRKGLKDMQKGLGPGG